MIYKAPKSQKESGRITEACMSHIYAPPGV